MKALVCTVLGHDTPLAIEETTLAAPGTNQVLIEVKAAAVNFPDALMLEGKYQFKPPMPFTPGCELAGIVRAVGEGAAFKEGDRVIAIVPYGAFAEQAIADVARVVPMPDSVSFEDAAAFLFTYGTSYHALKDRAQLREGETLLVLGAGGGVGLAAVELGRVMGARVIAAASTDAKLAACREHGANETINYASEDLRERLKALTEGKGVDVVYDPVGGAFAETAFRNLAWKGRHLVVGFANGEIPKLPMNLPLLKGASLVGVFWGDFTRREANLNRENMTQLVAWLGKGTLKPHIGARYPLAQGAEAINQVRDRHAVGKVLVLP